MDVIEKMKSCCNSCCECLCDSLKDACLYLAGFLICTGIPVGLWGGLTAAGSRAAGIALAATWWGGIVCCIACCICYKWANDGFQCGDDEENRTANMTNIEHNVHQALELSPHDVFEGVSALQVRCSDNPGEVKKFGEVLSSMGFFRNQSNDIGMETIRALETLKKERDEGRLVPLACRRN